MKLSAPIFRLKREARKLARNEGVPLSRALDRIASSEGFRSWGHLSSAHRHRRPEASVISNLEPGEMLLLAARPGHGKTVFGLQLLAESVRKGSAACFLSGEFSRASLRQCYKEAGIEPVSARMIGIEFTDNLCADVVIGRLQNAPSGTVAVIDYLQILDQRRVSPELAVQVADLKRFGVAHELKLIFLSQVHPSFEPAEKALPDFSDIRLPNPVDLSLFDKGCFLHEGELALRDMQ